MLPTALSGTPPPPLARIRQPRSSTAVDMATLFLLCGALQDYASGLSEGESLGAALRMANTSDRVDGDAPAAEHKDDNNKPEMFVALMDAFAPRCHL